MSKHRETTKDDENFTMLTGRRQFIADSSPLPHAADDDVIMAAGAVVWRDLNNDPSNPNYEVVVIHRPHYDDWSLPKGKLDPGESLTTCAVREIWEETGYEVKLGKLIGGVTYPIGAKQKVVYYWTARMLGGDFDVNSEVNELQWLPIDEAIERVSYDLDRQVLAKAKKRFAWKPITRMFLVRHAHAGDRREFHGDDLLRPLSKKGRTQAEALVGLLTPYRPTAVFSADPARCEQTVTPLAQELGVELVVDELFGDIAMIHSEAAAKARFAELVATHTDVVVCSQGHAIPSMLADFAASGTLPLTEEPWADKGSVWVLTFSEGRLCGADYIQSALPLL